MKRSSIKRKRPYVEPQERKIRESARDEECTLRLPLVCNGRTDTTVYCHSNRLEHGKGMGLKAEVGCYGCVNCHDVLDGRRPRPAHISHEDLIDTFDRACAETQAKLVSKGILK